MAQKPTLLDRRDQVEKKPRKWIQKAIKHPGALHKSLGVPQGEKIPAEKLEAAAHSSDATTRKRANLAMTLKGMHHGGSKKSLYDHSRKGD